MVNCRIWLGSCLHHAAMLVSSPVNSFGQCLPLGSNIRVFLMHHLSQPCEVEPQTPQRHTHTHPLRKDQNWPFLGVGFFLEGWSDLRKAPFGRSSLPQLAPGLGGSAGAPRCRLPGPGELERPFGEIERFSIEPIDDKPPTMDMY